jgi:signal transduction histidine kinase/HAMP domain-containing protein
MAIKTQSPEKPKFNIGIGTALNSYSVLLAVVPVMFVLFFALNQFGNQAREQTLNQMNSIAEFRVQEIERWLENGQIRLNIILANAIQVRDMRSIVDNPLPNTRLNDTVRVFLRSQLSAQTFFGELFLYDLRGRVRLTSTEGELSNISEAPYFAESLRGETIQPPTYNPDSDQIEIIITSPIYRNDTSSDIIGVLAGRLNLDELSAIMQAETGLGETGETYLVSTQGQLLTPTRFTGLTVGEVITSAGITSALSNTVTSNQFYENYRQEAVIGVSRFLPQLDALLVAEVEEAEALSALNQVRNISFIVAVIAAAVALIIGQGVTLWLTWPIRHLTKVAQAVMNGDYSQRAGLAPITEIGQLGEAFDTMTQNLVQSINERNERITEIEQLSSTLEMRVQERTRDLQVAAEVSKQITDVLEIDTLLQEVARMVAQSFMLYRCNLYRADMQTNTLRLVASADEYGRIIPDNRILALDDSNNPARAALSVTPITTNGTTSTPANLSIPMLRGNNLLGVFEAEASIGQELSVEVQNILTTLAEQTAIALRNAELYTSAEEARKEAEEANVVKSEFLANMSHELRTPLNAILNFAEFMVDGDLGDVTEEQIDALNKVISSGEHLLSLINDVLDITKIEVGMLELFIEDVDLNAAIRSVVSTGKGLLRDRPVDLITDIKAELPIIRGDRRRLQQVFLNLISNAVKFTPQGSITFTATHDDEQILVSVKDTGVGIAPHEQALIFESFRQAEHGRLATTGTGLGLPISKHFVEKHGGKIWLESNIDNGSTFFVSLPIQTNIDENPTL